MKTHCGLDSSSHIIDIGSGLGRPLLHALITEGIADAGGIEVDPIKCMKAESFLRHTYDALLKKNIIPSHHPPVKSLPGITCAPIENLKTLNPATHAYSFWEGIPIDARKAFGSLFARSTTLISVAVVQRRLNHTVDPAGYMEKSFDFCKLKLVDKFSVSMSGSNQQFTAFVFVRDDGKNKLKRKTVDSVHSMIKKQRIKSPYGLITPAAKDDIDENFDSIPDVCRAMTMRSMAMDETSYKTHTSNALPMKRVRRPNTLYSSKRDGAVVEKRNIGLVQSGAFFSIKKVAMQ